MQLNNNQIDHIKQLFFSLTNSLDSISYPINESIDCLTDAIQINVDPMIYFSKPRQTHEYLTFGAWRVMTNNQALALTQQSESIRCFGINSFDGQSDHIKNEYWVLPKCWLEKNVNQWAFHVVLDENTMPKERAWLQIDAIIQRINQSDSFFLDQHYSSVKK